MTSTRRTFFGTLAAGLGAVCFWKKAKPVGFSAVDGKRDLIFKASDYTGKWSYVGKTWESQLEIEQCSDRVAFLKRETDRILTIRQKKLDARLRKLNSQ
jgi:hypothetical protein